jgi:hypothetical protein
MVNKKIDEYHQSFRTAPIGRWQSVSGAFIVMHEDWEFYPDHKGKYTEYGPFGYPRRRTHFQWREYEELTILIGETKWENLEPVDKNEINGIDDGEPEDSIEEIEWMTVKYDFMIVTNEAGGEEIAMFQIGREYEDKACFYDCAPLAYRGPIEESE